MIEITFDSHPKLCTAIMLMTQRHGLDRWTVPCPLAAVEPTLAALSEYDLEVFSAGELDEMLAIAARSPALTTAHELLEAFYTQPDANEAYERALEAAYEYVSVRK